MKPMFELINVCPKCGSRYFEDNPDIQYQTSEPGYQCMVCKTKTHLHNMTWIKIEPPMTREFRTIALEHELIKTFRRKGTFLIEDFLDVALDKNIGESVLKDKIEQRILDMSDEELEKFYIKYNV